MPDFLKKILVNSALTQIFCAHLILIFLYWRQACIIFWSLFWLNFCTAYSCNISVPVEFPHIYSSKCLSTYSKTKFDKFCIVGYCIYGCNNLFTEFQKMKMLKFHPSFLNDGNRIGIGTYILRYSGKTQTHGPHLGIQITS